MCRRREGDHATRISATAITPFAIPASMPSSLDLAFLIAELLKQERGGKVKPVPAVAGF